MLKYRTRRKRIDLKDAAFIYKLESLLNSLVAGVFFY